MSRSLDAPSDDVKLSTAYRSPNLAVCDSRHTGGRSETNDAPRGDRHREGISRLGIGNRRWCQLGGWGDRVGVDKRGLVVYVCIRYSGGMEWKPCDLTADPGVYGTYVKACTEAHGPPPEWMEQPSVRHLCQEPACSEPQHLAWGTWADQARDKRIHAGAAPGAESLAAIEAGIEKAEVRRAGPSGRRGGRERTKSRPVSFRVPVEDWAALVSAADAGGESVGLYAARVVREAVESQADTPRYTGRWGVEAAMPTERDDLPTTPLLRRAFGGISTQSDETADEGVPDHGPTPADTPATPYTATESAETGEIGPNPDRSARIAALLAVTDP